MMEKELFRPDEVAEIFNVKIRTVRNWYKSGKLDANRITKRTIRITGESIENLKKIIKESGKVAES